MAANYPPWVAPFLEHLKRSCNMAESCRQVGVNYATMHALKSRDADFDAACDDALEEAFDYLEAECRRRAFDGIEEPIVYQGQLTPIFERDAQGNVLTDLDTGNPVQARDANGQPRYLTLRKYSDGLAMFLMKGYRRRKFGDKTELTGANGGPLSTVDETKKAARIAALLALAQSRKAGGDIDDLA